MLLRHAMAEKTRKSTPSAFIAAPPQMFDLAIISTMARLLHERIILSVVVCSLAAMLETWKRSSGGRTSPTTDLAGGDEWLYRGCQNGRRMIARDVGLVSQSQESLFNE